MLTHHYLPLGEVRVGDVFVDADWPTMFGNKVIAVTVREDDLSPRLGRQVSINLEHSCGITSREGYMTEVLR